MIPSNPRQPQSNSLSDRGANTASRSVSGGMRRGSIASSSGSGGSSSLESASTYDRPQTKTGSKMVSNSESQYDEAKRFLLGDIVPAEETPYPCFGK